MNEPAIIFDRLGIPTREVLGGGHEMELRISAKFRPKRTSPQPSLLEPIVGCLRPPHLPVPVSERRGEVPQ